MATSFLEDYNVKAESIWMNFFIIVMLKSVVSIMHFFFFFTLHCEPWTHAGSCKVRHMLFASLRSWQIFQMLTHLIIIIQKSHF